jgi:ribosomal 50S subunit-recycling heat shock protein
MRLDKFLKVARLAKRRTAAKDALDAGRIEVGGRAAKPSHRVAPGDRVLIHYATRDLEVRVRSVPERVGRRVDPESLYEVIAEWRTDGAP